MAGRALWRCGIALIAAWSAALPALAEDPPLSAEDYAIVDCLLPGQVRQLGRKNTYLSPRRPLRTAAYDCARRGGEFVAYDRASYETALATWLPRAKVGDPEASNQVGEIFERGLGTEPDPVEAASWYRRAAEAGHARAQVNLAHLYERGLGVEQDLVEALVWYRKAAALPDALLIDSEELARERAERERLRGQLRAAEQELDAARKRLQSLERRSEAKSAEERERFAQELEASRQQTEALRRRVREYGLELEDLGEAELAQASAPPEIAVIDPPLGLTRAAGVPERQISIPDDARRRTIVGRVTASGGLASLEVNGRTIRTNDRNVFEVAIPVAGAKSPVAIVATDANGKRAERRFVLVKGAGDPPEAPAEPVSTAEAASDFGRYYALVIGNNDYATLPNLRTAVADARAVAEVLRSRYGFQVELLENANREQLLSALNGFRERLTPNDNFVLYYAGHGEIDPVNRRGYWLPTDAAEDNPANWISNVLITDTLNVIRAKQAMVVVDACYSGALTRSGIARLGADMPDAERSHWLRVISRMRARTVLASGGLKPVSDVAYAGGTHSVFATSLLEVLRANQRVMEGQRLFREVAARVAYKTEQLALEQAPEYAPIRHAGHEAGDFLLVPSQL